MSTRFPIPGLALALSGMLVLSACGGEDEAPAEADSAPANVAVSESDTETSTEKESRSKDKESKDKDSKDKDKNKDSKSKDKDAAELAEICDEDKTVEDTGIGEFIKKGRAPIALIRGISAEAEKDLGDMKDFRIEEDHFDPCDAISYVIASGTFEGEDVLLPIAFNVGLPINDPGAPLSGTDLKVNKGTRLTVETTEVEGVENTGALEFQLTDRAYGALYTESRVNNPNGFVGLDFSDVEDSRKGAQMDDNVVVPTSEGDFHCIVGAEFFECYLDGTFTSPNGKEVNFFTTDFDDDSVTFGTNPESLEEFMGSRKTVDAKKGANRYGPPKFPVIITTNGKDVTFSLANDLVFGLENGEITDEPSL